MWFLQFPRPGWGSDCWSLIPKTKWAPQSNFCLLFCGHLISTAHNFGSRLPLQFYLFSLSIISPSAAVSVIDLYRRIVISSILSQRLWSGGLQRSTCNKKKEKDKVCFQGLYIPGKKRLSHAETSWPGTQASLFDFVWSGSRFWQQILITSIQDSSRCVWSAWSEWKVSQQKPVSFLFHWCPVKHCLRFTRRAVGYKCSESGDQERVARWHRAPRGNGGEVAAGLPVQSWPSQFAYCARSASSTKKCVSLDST